MNESDVLSFLGPGTLWPNGGFREVKRLAQDLYTRVGLDFNPFVLDSQTQAFNYLLIHFLSSCIFPVTPMAAFKNPSPVSRLKGAGTFCSKTMW